MILGVGVDIVDISRLRLIADRHADRFLGKVFTDDEIAAGRDRKDDFAFFAGRWAAKEALAKALGSGLGKNCRWLEINVAKDPQGRPFLVLSGATAAFAERKGVKNTHLSISHEKNMAVAMVTLEG